LEYTNLATRAEYQTTIAALREKLRDVRGAP